MTTYGHRQYRKNQVGSMDRGRQVVMLYEGAVNFLISALSNLEEGDEGVFNSLVNRAQNILNELNSSLNMEMGGEMAHNLRLLYVFMEDQLILAKIRKDPKPVNEVIGMLSNINDAWRGVVLPNGPHSKGI